MKHSNGPSGPWGCDKHCLRDHRGQADHFAAEPRSSQEAWERWDETWWLAEAENQLFRNCCRWHNEPQRSEKWNIWQQSLDLVSRACGYSCQMTLRQISWDFRCAHFRCMPQWGNGQQQQNEGYTLGNHVSMVNDWPRVEAYRSALGRTARGKQVLDVGCGPFCLLSRIALQAGARTVDCVEQNQRAVDYAIGIFRDEACGQESKVLRKIDASFAEYDLSGYERKDGQDNPRLSLLAGASQPPFDRTLQLFQGFSSDVPLPGGYNLVVHEILGHIASSEGVVTAISNLRNRGLLSPDCLFVPRRAATLFVPTMEFELTCLERILCLFGSGQDSNLHCLTKYNADRFPQGAFLAPPALFEDLDFGGDLKTQRHAVVEFVTDCSGVFQGLHFHMVVDMDGHACINTLLDDTSWNTTYVKLLDPGIFLPVGSRIICETWIQLDRPDPLYSIAVSVDGKQVAEFCWSGCSG